MYRFVTVAALLALVACEEPEPPAQGPWRVVSADVDEGIVVERGQERRTVTLGQIRLPEWTEERDLYRDHVQEALTDIAVGRELLVRGEDDAADLRGDGRWVNLELVERGWARPADGADAAIVEAEAEAREAEAGGWGAELRDEAIAWLRARADGEVVSGTHDVATERRMRWDAAREAHAEALSFFEIELPTDAPEPLTCRDRVRESLAQVEAASPRELTRELSVMFSSEELYRVVALPPNDAGRRQLTCRRYAIRDLDEAGRELAAGWDEDGAQVLEHLAFEVRTGEAPAIDITAARRERGDETESRTAEGAQTVSATIDGGLVIGQMPWLSTRDACRGWLATTLRTLAPECLPR